MDWPNGDSHNDFLGFAIRRTPGFQDNKTGYFSEHSCLPNRIGFNGPPLLVNLICHPMKPPFRSFFGGTQG